MFKIEKGVPRDTERATYPFKKMEVGDSFEYNSAITTRVVSAANQFSASHPPYKFSTKKQGNGKHRIWRIA